ncbi:MAG: AAA family ATPase [Candidatus Omnitrophica bacterium]|nr:AAA family ATPase [Candidatus Omnitrophota bacterium]
MPKVIIFAGANGSGKTTLAKSVLDKGAVFINADGIRDKERISPLSAGKKSLFLIQEHIRAGDNFSFETTMSGLTLVNNFRLLKKQEYAIVIFYLFVHPVELLIERIKERVKKGGHEVLPEDVIRRYYRSANNFWNLYRQFSNEWAIINNNESRYRNISVGDKNIFQVVDNQEFSIFEEVTKNAKK